MKALIAKIQLKHLMIPIIAFLAPIKPLIILVGLFIAADTITGVWKSKVNKIPISSRALSAIISKMLLYQACVLLFFGLETYILTDFIQIFSHIPLLLTKLVATVLVGIEITSINENFKAATSLSLWDRIKQLLRRAQNAKNELKEFDDVLPIDKLKGKKED